MDSDSNRHQSHEKEEAEVSRIKIKNDDDDEDDNKEIMIDMDGENLIFSSLPDFPCLSSPTSASSATNPHLHHHHHLVGPNSNSCNMSTSSTSSNSTSSTSSSSWAPAAGPLLHMQQQQQQQPPPCQQPQQQEEDDTYDIFGDIAAELLDPSFIFPANDLFLLLDHEEDGGNQEHNNNNNNNSNSNSNGNGFDNNNNNNDNDIQEIRREKEDKELSDDLAAIFLEWLKSNRDTISPEDLRSIKLKKSTIECASARLGGTKQGRTQLLKLILTWVQDHHLRKKQGMAPQPPDPPPPSQKVQAMDQCYYYFPNYPQYPTPNPNPNTMMNLDYMNWEPSWMPPPPPPPQSPLPPPPPYNNYYQSGGGCGPGIVMNGQPFSPPGDFHTPPPVMNYPPFVGGPPLPQYAMYPNGTGGGASCCVPVGPRAAASATREARKKRMARQRRLSSLHQNRSSTITQSASMANVPKRPTGGSSSNSKRLSFWSSRQKNLVTSDHRNVNTPVMMPTPAASNPSNMQQLQLQDVGSNPSDKRVPQRSEKNLKFLLQKVLKQSDVGSLGRIVLPKKEAEIHLPELDSRDGISIPMEDIGTSRVWTMRYRFWPNNKSRMYLLENTGDFVQANELQEGDFILIYSDVKCNKYMIRGVKVRQTLELKETNVGKAHQRKKKNNNKCSNSEVIAISSSVENYDYSIRELNPYSDEDGDDSASRTMVDVI